LAPRDQQALKLNQFRLPVRQTGAPSKSAPPHGAAQPRFALSFIFIAGLLADGSDSFACDCLLLTRSYRRHHRSTRPVNRTADKRMSKAFSSSFWQMMTSPAPQPQSKRIAQKGIALAEWMARARFSTANVKATSITSARQAVPRTAMPLNNSNPHRTSNQGSTAAMKSSRM